jgi:hypothetical protein
MANTDSEDDLFDSEGDVEEELMEGLDDIEVEEASDVGDVIRLSCYSINLIMNCC